MHNFTYDIERSYAENYELGPAFTTPAPDVPRVPMKTFLGLPVRSRIGIAAGLLLNSNWVLGYAERGFDILTYKTVRSRPRQCYDLPNWVFVEDLGAKDGPVYVSEQPDDDASALNSAVCFGTPSMSAAVWRADVEIAKASLSTGQLLSVSVVATPADTTTAMDMAADFMQCAVWAVEAGADIVEANFLCPNVGTAEGSIYLDPEFTSLICRKIRSAIPGVPVLVKAGAFEEEASLLSFLKSLDGVADGVVLVNGVTRSIVNRDGSPAFGPDRVNVGVLGRAIHDTSVASTRTAVEIVQRLGLDLAIVSVGGISSTNDMGDFFTAGAAAVMLGSAPMYLPDVAATAKVCHPEW